MKKSLLFLTIICITNHIYGMKRAHTDELDRPNKKSCIQQEPFLLLSLPGDMQTIIFEFMTNKIAPFKKQKMKFPIQPHQTGFKPKEATAAIWSLSYVNKFYNRKINDVSFSNALIQNLSNKFFCTNETIAHNLATRTALEQLKLQMDLKRICFSLNMSPVVIQNNLNYLCKKNVNLDFTYNHKGQHRTPLMLCIERNSNALQPLLDSGANINAGNVFGVTPLMLEAEFTILPTHVGKLLAHANIIVDQQNRWGESALLCTLKKQNRYSVSAGFIHLVKQLLKAGADPKLADKYGNTPLSIAQFWQDLRILQPIENAIAKKTLP
jgi:hypothetical protein